jgi:cysteine synthase A
VQDDLTARRLHGLRHLIGNSPILAIECTWRGARRTIYAKAENLNMTGSIKDRMALHILQRAYADGRIAPGDPIAEATSGNTGMAFAAIGRALGHPVTIFMPDWMSRERKDLIASFGATVVSVSRDEVASSAASRAPRRGPPATRVSSSRRSSPTKPIRWRTR